EGQGDRPASRRAVLPQAGLGRARPRLGRLARVHPDPDRPAPAPRPTPLTARTPGPTAPTPPPRHRSDTTRNCQRHRITSTASSGAHVRAFYTAPGTPPCSEQQLFSSLMVWLTVIGAARHRRRGTALQAGGYRLRGRKHDRTSAGSPAITAVVAEKLTKNRDELADPVSVTPAVTD